MYGTGKAIAVFLFGLLLSVGMLFFGAWIAFLAWGILVTVFGVPTMTYWQVFFLVWAIRYLVKGRDFTGKKE